MSMLTIAAFVVGYVAVVGLALTLLAAAKRADDDAEREHEQFVRSMTDDGPLVLVTEDDQGREIVVRRRAG